MGRAKSPERQKLLAERAARREERLKRKESNGEPKKERKPRVSRMSPERQKLLAERDARREERLKRKAAKEEKQLAKNIKKERKTLINTPKIEEKEFKHRKKEAAKRVEEKGGVVVAKPIMEVSSFENMDTPVSLLCRVCHQVKKSTEFINPDDDICEMCFFKQAFDV